MAEATRDTASGFSPRRRAALLVTLLAVLMDMIDSTVVNVALPSLRSRLHASPTELEWTIAGYTLAFASAMIVGGRLGDRHGRRRVFLIGLGAFMITSVACGLAVEPGMLIAARVLQGASAALMVPQVLAMVQVEFPRAEQSKAMQLYGLTFSVGGLGGPLLGGLLLNADLFGLNWRPIFFVNVPIGAVSLIGTRMLARESRSAHSGRTDWVGAATITGALLALLYPLVEGRALGWPWWCFALLALCPVLLAAFSLHERAVLRRGGRPLIDPNVFRHRGADGGLLVALLFFAGMAYSLVLTVHLQSGLGYSPLRAALAMVPFTVGVGIGSLFAPRWRPLGRRLAFIGSTIIVLGLGAATAAIDRYGVDLRWWQLLPGLVVAGFGMAMVSGTLVATVLARMPRQLAGTAASIVNTNIQVGAAAGVAFIGTVYFGQVAHGSVHAAMVAMICVLGLYAASALASFALPPGRLVWAADDAPAAAAKQSAEPSGAGV
jgi:EmrB/QacA subfamily drug resistance transporter